MFGKLKRLGGETAVYGLSSIAGRFLNLFLLPLYTHTLSTSDYGVAAVVFSGIAFLNVLYIHGMDFSYMRYLGREEKEEPRSVFVSALLSVFLASALLSAVLVWSAPALSLWLGMPPRYSFIWKYAAGIMTLDALAAVPFAGLRMAHRARLYALIRVLGMAANLILSFLFLDRCRWGVAGVFLAALAASAGTFVLLIPELWKQLRGALSLRGNLWLRLLRFGLPLVPAGLASTLVNVADRPILARFLGDSAVGVYQANYRIGIVMMIFVGMFDMAFRPFFIEGAHEDDSRAVLGRILTYYAVAASLIFLALSLFCGALVRLPVWAGKPLIAPAYWPGLRIVPVVALGYFFYGFYVNWLAPVTLAKKTEFAAAATALGAAVNLGLLLVLIPRWGMLGAAWATPAAYAAMAAALYLSGRGLYPVPYEAGRLIHASLALAGVWALALGLGVDFSASRPWLRLAIVAAFPLLLLGTGFLKEDERSALKEFFRRGA